MDILSLEGKRDFPLTTNSLAFMQAAYVAMEKMGYIGGDNYIVSGCTVTGSSVSDGYVFLKGILMPFKGGTVPTHGFVKIVKVISTVNVDAGVREQISYRAEFGQSLDSSENVAWSDITRIDNIIGIMGQVADLNNRLTDAEDDIIANAKDTQGNADDIQDLQGSKLDKSEACGMKLILRATVTDEGFVTKLYGGLEVQGQRLSAGRYRITHSLGSTGYIIIANTISNNPLSSDGLGNTQKIAEIYYAKDYFEVVTADDNERDSNYFEFVLMQFNV